MHLAPSYIKDLNERLRAMQREIDKLKFRNMKPA